jgi:O-methyltransferase
MRFFYPRLVPGGVILCDDYGFTTCPGVRRAVDEFMADKPEHVVHVPTGHGFLVKQ